MNIDEEIPYQMIRSARKTVAIQIEPDGRVTVRAPYWCSRADADAFVREKRDWIRRKLREQRLRAVAREEAAKNAPDGMLPRPRNVKERERCIRQAASIFAEKTAHYAEAMGVDYSRITLRQQKTRWGSCSARGSLNFNWKLVFASEPVLDYVIVHELAHRREMNHSPRFWSVVEEAMPDYRAQRAWLRRYGDTLLQEKTDCSF